MQTNLVLTVTIACASEQAEAVTDPTAEILVASTLRDGLAARGLSPVDVTAVLRLREYNVLQGSTIATPLSGS